MKNIFILLCFWSICSFSQNSYFVDKKGNKTIMRDDAIDVILIDKRISYILPGKSWEKYIKFKNLDYAIIGSSVLKSFKLNNKSRSEVYFIFAEKADKKLIGASIVYSSNNGSHTVYKLFVIDNDNMILDELTLGSYNSKNQINARTSVEPMVLKHFSDCPMILDKLNRYTKYDEKNESIFGFIDNTSYINCNQ